MQFIYATLQLCSRNRSWNCLLILEIQVFAFLWKEALHSLDSHIFSLYLETIWNGQKRANTKLGTMSVDHV